MQQDRDLWEEVSARMQRVLEKSARALEEIGKLNIKQREKYETSSMHFTSFNNYRT